MTDEKTEWGIGSSSGNVGVEEVVNSGASTSQPNDLNVDQELLMEAVRRRPLLSELRTGPATATDLVESLDRSRSTVHRATTKLVEMDLITKTDGQFALTGLGAVVAEETETFRARVGGATAIEPFLNAVKTNEIPVEHFADATVIRPQPRQPHLSVRRIMELIERSETLSMFSAVISPFYVDVAHREIMNGMNIEVIFDDQIIDIVLSEYGQRAHEAVTTGNFDVFVHGDIPFELFLFDDRVGMATHDDSGTARVFVETDAPAAVEWASDLYEDYREHSDSVISHFD